MAENNYKVNRAGMLNEMNKERIPWYWLVGLPREIFSERENIGYIKQYGLSPLTIDQQMPYLQGIYNISIQPAGNVMLPLSKADIVAPKPIGATDSEKQVLIHGGMKKPHLHYDGKIYPLNADQWNQIANNALEKLGKSLANTKTISFDNFKKIAAIVEEIT